MTIPQTTANMLKHMGIRLKECRQKKYGNQRGSLKDCADGLGITPQTWNDYEAGRTEISFGKVVFFADFFNVSPAWLLTGEGEMMRQSSSAGSISSLSLPTDLSPGEIRAMAEKLLRLADKLEELT